jgi:hypothetical protein
MRFFVLAAAAVTIAASTLPGFALDDAHVAWCSANYKTYNAVTDTFTGTDGKAHACISPVQTFGATDSNRFVTVLPAAPNGAAGSGHSYSVFPDENSASYGGGLDNAAAFPR